MRVAFIGAGWIAGIHLEALARLGRSELVGVVSGSPERAAEVAARWGGAAYPDPDRDARRGQAATPCYLCVPPHRAVEIGERLVERGIPFLAEKPLAAADAEGPARLAAAIERSGLVVAVGYHLRGLEVVSEIRRQFAALPAADGRRPLARLDAAPGVVGSVDQGGGQVVEQATHFYDLARHLLGEAEVLGAVSTRDPAASPPSIDVVDATAALLRFDRGAIGSFANTRRLASSRIEIEFVSDDLLTTAPARAGTAGRAAGRRRSTTAGPSSTCPPGATRTRCRPRRSSTPSRRATGRESSRATRTRSGPTG